MTISPLSRRLAGAALACLMAGAALAHHGFRGRYDLSQPLWLEGEVTAAYFGQPHAELTFRVPETLVAPAEPPDLAGAEDVVDLARLTVRPDATGREVTIEFPPIRAFFALDGQVRPGDRIAVIAFRNCDPPHQLRGQWIRPAGAQPVGRGGRMRYQVEGC